MKSRPVFFCLFFQVCCKLVQTVTYMDVIALYFCLSARIIYFYVTFSGVRMQIIINRKLSSECHDEHFAFSICIVTAWLQTKSCYFWILAKLYEFNILPAVYSQENKNCPSGFCIQAAGHYKRHIVCFGMCLRIFASFERITLGHPRPPARPVEWIQKTDGKYLVF